MTMKKQYLLDTNICVHFLRGKYELGRKLAAAGINNCFISEVTLAELAYGAEFSGRQKHRDEVEQFARFFQHIPFSEAIPTYAK